MTEKEWEELDEVTRPNLELFREFQLWYDNLKFDKFRKFKAEHPKLFSEKRYHGKET